MITFTPSAQQNQAIQFGSNMVITARPGSGKTSVLSCKVRNLVDQLSSHQGIIAISYTNKASDELKHRCKANAFNVKSSFFGTIDSFCLREIIFPFARHLTPMPDEVEVIETRGLPQSVKQLLPVTMFHDCNVANLVDFLPFLKEALAQGFVPMETVGMLARYIIEQSLACQRYLLARYSAVYIDEYQDSGYFQHQIFLMLKELGLTAVAVGDIDQSIYSFAHKDSIYLTELATQGSGFTHFAITTNFRSHQSINDFALRLLDPNYPVIHTNNNRVLIKTINGDQRSMGAWLQIAVPHLMNFYQVDTADKVAILCRSQHSAEIIGDHIGLQHHIFKNSPFKTTHPTEAGVFENILRFRYDRKLTAETLIEHANLHKISHQELRALRRAIQNCRSCLDNDLAASVSDAAQRLLGQTLSAHGITELANICQNANKLCFFYKPFENAIQIMTLHKSKGLEFDLVFHADLYDHILPKRIYPQGYSGVFFENETQCLNLHYVGITRAIKACILMTSNARINGQGNIKSGSPSQFIGRNGTNATPIPW